MTNPNRNELESLLSQATQALEYLEDLLTDTEDYMEECREDANLNSEVQLLRNVVQHLDQAAGRN